VIKAFSCTNPSQPEVVEGIIQEMKKQGVARSSITYTSLITAYANTATVDPTKAENVLQEMFAEGLQPSLITFTSVLKTYAQAKPPRLEAMLKTIGKMEEKGPQPNTISYNIVMGSCAAKPSQPELCEELMSRMIANHSAPNCHSYNAIGRAYLNSSPVRAEEAENVLWRIKADHAKSGSTDGPMWDAITWTTAISAYARCQVPRPADGLRLLHSMHDHGLEPDTLAFSGVIAAYIKMRPAQINAAERVLNTMIEMKIPPNSFAFSSVAMAYVNTKPSSLSGANRVVKHMEAHGFAPDRILRRAIEHAEKRRRA